MLFVVQQNVINQFMIDSYSDRHALNEWDEIERLGMGSWDWGRVIPFPFPFPFPYTEFQKQYIDLQLQLLNVFLNVLYYF